MTLFRRLTLLRYIYSAQKPESEWRAKDHVDSVNACVLALQLDSDKTFDCLRETMQTEHNVRQNENDIKAYTLTSASHPSLTSNLQCLSSRRLSDLNRFLREPSKMRVMMIAEEISNDSGIALQQEAVGHVV